MTNYEKIKAMSVEEMAEMLSECTSLCATCIHTHCPMAWGTPCKEYMQKFLESEVEEDG